MKDEKNYQRGGWEVYATLLCAVLLHSTTQALGWVFQAATETFSGHYIVFVGESAFHSALLGRLTGLILVFSFCIGFGISAIRKGSIWLPIASIVFSSFYSVGRVIPLIK